MEYRGAKKTVFNQYDALQKQAGEAGAVIDTKPIADMLEASVNLPDVQLNNPEFATTLLKMSENYRKRGKLTLQDAQDVVEGLNSRLETFFKRPDYNSATHAAAAAAISRAIREQMDTVIEKSATSGYQALRNQYKALKTVEKDLARQVAVEMRKNQKGLLDFTDIFTGSDILQGIVTANPAAVVRGLAGRGFKEWYKSMNDPNLYINKAFELLEKSSKKKPPTQSTQLSL